MCVRIMQPNIQVSHDIPEYLVAYFLRNAHISTLYYYCCFVFSVGMKENTSCEMSSKIVKETADFRPIGTVNDTDYDLYVKKIGCKLVIEINKNKPTTNVKPDQIRNNNDNKDQNSTFPHYDGPLNDPRMPYIPHHDNQNDEHPGYEYKRPEYGFMYAPNFYGPPMKVQSSLIGVSPPSGALNGETNVNRVDSYYSGSNNYLSHGGDRYFHGNPGPDDNLLYDSGPPYSEDRPNRDRLPPPFSSNYGKPEGFYIEESNYEQSDHRFASMSHGHRYKPFESRYPQKPYHSRPGWAHGTGPEFGAFHNGYNEEYPPMGYEDESYSMGNSDSNSISYHEQEFLPDRDEFNRPSYRPNGLHNNYDNKYPSPDIFNYHYPADYSEYTYGSLYPHYKQPGDYSSQSVIKPLNETSYNTIFNKTEYSEDTNTTNTVHSVEVPETESNHTEGNSTSVHTDSNGSIVSETIGPHGETITSIITELKPGE